VPEATLVLVGDGDRTPLESLASSLGVSDSVLVLAPRPDVPDLLAAMDLFIHPALAESFAMVIIEAMAMGRPVLSTSVGIAPEAIEDGVSGFLAADGSESALQSRLKRAFDHRRAWPAIANEARRRAHDYRADAMIEAHENLYEALVSSNHAYAPRKG
jgi:glycosyltransferase involved in cell wall biosynthesis